MKYCSIDELETFAFHNGKLHCAQWDEDDLTLQVGNINATTENSQNAAPTDLCIGQAMIRFSKAELTAIRVFAEAERPAPNHIIMELSPPLPDQDSYWDFLQRAIGTTGAVILSKEDLQINHGKTAVTFLLEGASDVFQLTISYDQAQISWDKFSGSAWYVSWPENAPK